MTTKIEDLLKHFESDNMIVKIIKSQELLKQFNELAKSLPEFSFFVYLINHYGKRYVFPEDIVALCKSLNIITINDLINWAEKSCNGKVIMPIIDPHPTFKLTVKKTSVELMQLIKSTCDCESSCQWDFGDSNYYLLSEDNLREVLAKCPIDKQKYIPDSFDCEDFARDTKCWLSTHGLGSVAFANIEVNFYRDNKLLFAHGINLVPLDNGLVVGVEPQKDRIWPADKPEYGFGANKMKLRLVQF